MVKRVLTVNGPCSRSLTFEEALGSAAVTRKFNRPYLPKPTRKVERYDRAMLDERAYARP